MSKSFWTFSSGSGSVTSGRYTSLIGQAGWSTNETSQHAYISANGTFSNLRIVLSGAPGAGTSYVFTVYKNASPTALEVTIADTDTTGFDTNEVSVVPGDTISLYCVGVNTPASRGADGSIEFDSTTAKQSILTNNSGATYTTADDSWHPIMGKTFHSATYEQKVMVAPCSGTIKDLYVKLATSPGAGDTRTFTVYKNGAPTTLTTTISESATSNSDTTHSFTVSAGDLVVTKHEYTGTPTNTYQCRICVVFEADTDGNFWLPYAGSTLVNSATRYTEIIGSVIDSSAGDINGRAQDATIKAMYIWLEVAPDTGKSYTFDLYVGSDYTAMVDTVSNLETTGSYIGDISLSNDNSIFTRIVPSGTPDVGNCAISYLGYIESGAPAIGGYMTTNSKFWGA